MDRVSFHKGVLRPLIAIALLTILLPTNAQQTPPAHRIRAVIADLRSAHQAHDVDLALRALPGVRMSRTDFNTRNLLLDVSADCTIDRAQVEALLSPHGLALSCWKRAPQGAPDDGLLDPRSCAEPVMER